MWRSELTFPPFNPKQIGAQLHWRRRIDGSYRDCPRSKWVHKPLLGRSADNLNNRIAAFTDSGLFVWFTSHTQDNAHGSILVYSVAPQGGQWLVCVSEAGMRVADRQSGGDWQEYCGGLFPDSGDSNALGRCNFPLSQAQGYAASKRSSRVFFGRIRLR